MHSRHLLRVLKILMDHSLTGDYGVLCRYQQRRQSDREATIGVTDSLVHLFANRWTPLVVGRNIGLMTMELFTPARDVLAQRTLGWVAR